MIHPATELRLVSPHVGYGVFAVQRIPKGTIVFVQDPLDIEISLSQYLAFDPVIQESVEKYSYVDSRGIRILSWDIAKYVNHSCHPNTISTGWGFEVAVRDIEAGEEITDEYGLFNLEWAMDCQCGHSACRGRIQPSDAEVMADLWDLPVRSAVEEIPSVDQPLIGCLDTVTRASLEEYLSGIGSYRPLHFLLRKAEPHACAS